MNNIKAIAFTTDGSMKRMAITYDVIDENGKIKKSNSKMNRVVTDESAVEHITALAEYAQTIVDGE